MNGWNDVLHEMETYIVALRVQNPRAAIKLREWLKRFRHIQAHPDCTSLQELGVSPPYTIDLSLLYPRRRRAA